MGSDTTIILSRVRCFKDSTEKGMEQGGEGMRALKEGKVWKLTEKGCALIALHESGFLPKPKDGELYSTETEAQIERFWKLFTEARRRAGKRA